MKFANGPPTVEVHRFYSLLQVRQNDVWGVSPPLFQGQISPRPIPPRPVSHLSGMEELIVGLSIYLFIVFKLLFYLFLFIFIYYLLFTNTRCR
jgi:hypothetical protein